MEAVILLEDGSAYDLKDVESEKSPLETAKAFLKLIRKDHVPSTLFFGGEEIEIAASNTDFSTVIKALLWEASFFASRDTLYSVIEKTRSEYFKHAEETKERPTIANMCNWFELEVSCWDDDEIELLAKEIKEFFEDKPNAIF